MLHMKNTNINYNKLKTYHGHIDFTVANNSHTQAFMFLKEHCENNKILSPRVLEIGCSSGYFSAAMKENGIHVYGIEPFSTEAKDNGYVDEFYHGTVEDFTNIAESFLSNSFDAVILGDILEHLINPEKILKKLSYFLKNDGVFIASIPNITHIAIRQMLSDRQWIYQKYGLLDSTHLRFFSWNSIRELFIKIGFGIERKYNILISEFQVYPSAISAITFSNNTPLNSEDHTFQFVLRASKQAFFEQAYSNTYPKHVLVISPDPKSSLTKLRLTNPLCSLLHEVGGDLVVLSHIQCKIEHIKWAEVIILHREISIFAVELIREARKYGIPIIYDLDDLITQIPKWSLAKINRIDKILIENTIATANRVTCTCKPLKKELEKLSDNVIIVPNTMITPKKITNPTCKQNNTECTIVISSSDTVLVEFIINPVKLLCDTIPNLKVVTIGPISSAFNNITAQIEHYAQCSPDEFSHILNKIDNGIGLIPLDNSLFSSCKSDIKYYHYTSCGIVTIASAVQPYTECIEHEKNGLLVENTLENWFNSTSYLIKNYKVRQLLLTKAIRTWQKNGSNNTAITAWKNAFTGLPKAKINIDN
ncbi:MAG: methyltransferase domain-containing protein [Desulfomicrobium sp.]|nr:methyltransferase domain-containing protein [Pseudomonadota bacterium]MBU4594995.1 methyltransferase domain-containing protein [Pseudomonadota bacterium]MBV1711225.1 methyltransferase domain-containing protein [Desulfomicrobium sp.]MBV1746879.1 methyltransferase domain-containing protein [Desulfomicrobium sp.]